MAQVGIVIDDWKLEIFARRLSLSGYAFYVTRGIVPGTYSLHVSTDNVEALGEVVRAANDEAKNQPATQRS